MGLKASNVAPGDHCVFEEAGEPWPVVVFPEYNLPSFVLANRPDGAVFPVLLLGKHEIRWAFESDLEGYIPFDSAELPEDDCLRRAHSEAAKYKDLSHYEALWRDACYARRSQNHAVSEDESEAPPAAKKVKVSKTPRKLKTTQKPMDPRQDVGGPSGGYERFMSSLGSVKTEPDMYGDSGEDSDTQGSAKPKPALKPSDGFVRIRVGNPITITKVPLKRVESYPFLDRIRQREEDGEWYISRSPFFDFQIKFFDPVAEFLRGGEYRPRLVDDGTDQATLEDVTTADTVSKEVFKCGTTFQYAGQVKMHDLQRLAVRKLAVLRPYPPEPILHVAKIVYGHTPGDSDPQATAAIRDLLECHIAEYFWKITETDLVTLTRLMEEHADLAQKVFEKRVEMAEAKRASPDEDE